MWKKQEKYDSEDDSYDNESYKIDYIEERQEIDEISDEEEYEEN